MRLPVQLLPDSLSSVVHQQLLQERLTLLAVRYEPTQVASNYTFTERDEVDSLQVNATAAALTVTLPSPTGNRRRRIIKTDSSANTITIVGTINGATNYTLTTQYSWIEVEPTGTAWLIVGADFGFYNGYSEGTWTPSIGGTATYTNQQGYYTRIGRLVNVHGRLTINVIGTGSTGTISGLPFASLIPVIGAVGVFANLSANYVFVGCFTNGSTVGLSGHTAATATSGVITPLQNGSDVYFNLTYPV